MPRFDRVRYACSQNEISGNASLMNRKMLFVFAVDAEKVCQLCEQEMLITAGYAECGDLCVVRSCQTLAKKTHHVSS